MALHLNGEDAIYVPMKPSQPNGDVAVYFTKESNPGAGSIGFSPLRVSGVQHPDTEAAHCNGRVDDRAERSMRYSPITGRIASYVIN